MLRTPCLTYATRCCGCSMARCSGACGAATTSSGWRHARMPQSSLQPAPAQQRQHVRALQAPPRKHPRVRPRRRHGDPRQRLYRHCRRHLRRRCCCCRRRRLQSCNRRILRQRQHLLLPAHIKGQLHSMLLSTARQNPEAVGVRALQLRVRQHCLAMQLRWQRLRRLCRCRPMPSAAARACQQWVRAATRRLQALSMLCQVLWRRLRRTRTHGSGCIGRCSWHTSRCQRCSAPRLNSLWGTRVLSMQPRLYQKPAVQRRASRLLTATAAMRAALLCSTTLALPLSKSMLPVMGAMSHHGALQRPVQLCQASRTAACHTVVMQAQAPQQKTQLTHLRIRKAKAPAADAADDGAAA